MTRRLTLLATLLAVSLASASAKSCDHGDLDSTARATCVDCTGDFAGHRCLNGGVCSTGADTDKPDRVCQCGSDYTGPQCALEIERCPGGFYCANGGTCASSSCDCPLGYSGHRCDISDVMDTCTSSALAGQVCLHGGYCYGTDPERPCQCRYNHAGPNCEIKDVVKCSNDDDDDDDAVYDEVYCQNDGVCNSQNTGCVCAFGFMGPTCGEVNYDQINGVKSNKDDSARLAGYVAAPLVIVIVLMCAGGAYMVRKERATGKPLFVRQMDELEMQQPRA
mmetsp:Transcript_1925/g.7992  ORF Transcript_1925/g.7992 Transcript_1925/m.7992 type:complete len:278 (+) Transcript_1925:19-852(+)